MQIFLQINGRIIFRGQIWERVSDVMDEDPDEIECSDNNEFGFQIARHNLRDETSLESYEDDESEDEDDPYDRRPKGKGTDEA